tara:strand:- start:1783 stop:2262 length:480 start_codon:yes stop_codon:yes gene_type:complete
MSLKKVFTLKELKQFIFNLKKDNFEIGFTNGCFDLLHRGHLHLLAQSKKKCDFLIVGLNSDSSIKSLKGNTRPIEKEVTRIKKLSNISDIDALIVFSDEAPLNIIKEIQPDILFKGSDYRDKDIIGSKSVLKKGGKVILIELLNGYSTTNIIEKSGANY